MKITETDWLTLRNFNHQITRRISEQLPSDWLLSREDIEGAVYDSFVQLLANYREGAMSPTSYCYQFAERYTLRELWKEYRRLKKNLVISETTDQEDDTVRHQVGVGEVDELTVDERESQENRDMVKVAFDCATPEDREIMTAIMDGDSYEEIAKKMGISKMEITRRMRKYAAQMGVRK